MKRGKVGKELKKQDVVVADKSGACPMESDVKTEPVTSSMDYVSANIGQPSSCPSPQRALVTSKRKCVRCKMTILLAELLRVKYLRCIVRYQVCQLP